LVAALSGVLGEVLDERVNLVNAAVLAAEAGLTVTEDWTSAAEAYQHEVEVSLDTALGVRNIRGALFGRSEARIIGLDGYELELRPEGVMLFYRNVDRPGMLAAVGALVAEAGVNIGAMAIGRRREGGAALTVMHLDDQLPARTLSAIEAVDGLTDVRQIEVGLSKRGAI
jgi:D-3-phosphoglycerate dehydrogenase